MQTQPETALGAYAHLMMAHLPVGAALFEIHGWLLLAANAHFQSFLDPRWQQECATGHHFTEVLPGREHRELLAMCQRVKETGVSCRMPASRRFASSGEKSSWDWILTPIGEQGQVHFILLTCALVTDQPVARLLPEQ